MTLNFSTIFAGSDWIRAWNFSIEKPACNLCIVYILKVHPRQILVTAPLNYSLWKKSSLGFLSSSDVIFANDLKSSFPHRSCSWKRSERVGERGPHDVSLCEDFEEI